MAEFESLESVKRKLEGIRSEHSARMELASRKFEETDKATAQSHKDFVDKSKRLVDRLREMAKAQREGPVKKKPSELAFGIEDDEQGPDEFADQVAAAERARLAAASHTVEGSFLQGAPQAAPSRWTPPQPTPEPAPQPPVRPLPPTRRPPQRPAADDDDDFGNASYLT
ncbi:hypothetical protein ACFFQW_20520 [Umezawaea endophytica]|uniref:Uncharacterized protein n=1 Tax=Umezawaea endophytica TaxID=1654476 RepID=A0A9X2VT53_9PSEU|nr:hypothetical protein [Umezawaea endophytica]MCS7482300.1 hypothetical protein [Umezawaea endophytica]